MTFTTDPSAFLPSGAAVDLDNCAREAIHIPGLVQPRGALLAVRERDLTIMQVSANLTAVLGVAVDGALGRSLFSVLGADAASAIRRAVAVFGDLRERNPVLATLEVDGQRTTFDMILHRTNDTTLLVELEAATGVRPFSFPNTYLAVRSAISNLNSAATLDELYAITASAVQELTGFDRVMVYRYDALFNGEVVAETKRDGLDSFLGLHYPASDIPAQARALYERNWIRLISDVDYEPVPVIPPLDAATGEALDLSLATLRSVSPVHLEYLHNMGVRASMSISLLRHGALWGLIACHHYAGPHTPPYAVRAAAEFLGSTLSLRLVDRAEDTELRNRLAGRLTLARLTAATLDEAEPLAHTLLAGPSLLDLVPADGVVVSAEGVRRSRGRVPDAATVVAIADWVAARDDQLIATDSLSQAAPELAIPAAVVSGILALPLPDRQYAIWFRDEVVQALDWGGDPDATHAIADDPTHRLSPRKSFERWRQTVHQRSHPWTNDQLDLARDLRQHTVEALYRRSRRGLHLAETLQRSLLPRTLAVVPDWSITAHYQIPQGGQVGGDWYDAFLLPDRTLAVVLGDVAGHGIASAGIMAELRHALRAYLTDHNGPADAVSKLNLFTERLLPPAFATAIVALIDTDTRRVTTCSAGHLIPYLMNQGTAVPVETSPCPPLGVTGARYVDYTFTLPPGAGLVLYSDGLIERRTEDLSLGLERLQNVLTALSPRPSAEKIFTAVDNRAAFDDATVLAVHSPPA